MSMKQKAMVNTLSKYCQKYFVYKRTDGQKDRKVRIRDDFSRVEQVPDDDRTQRVRRRPRNLSMNIQKFVFRLKDMEDGVMTVSQEPYRPVRGWPTLELDELVINSFGDYLDPEIGPAVRKVFLKPEIARTKFVKSHDYLFRDQRFLFTYPTAGYQLIRAHIKESEDRLPTVYAGHSFRLHFDKALRQRKERGSPDEEANQLMGFFSNEEEYGIDRVLRDEVKFLQDLEGLMRMLFLIKTRHLMSKVPIRLDHLGTEKDKKQCPEPHRATLRRRRPLSRPQYSFAELIVSESPLEMKRTSSAQSRHPWQSRSELGQRFKRSQNVGQQGSRTQLASPSAPSLLGSSTSLNNEKEREKTEASKSKGADLFTMCRKPWPPLWMTIAATEQALELENDSQTKVKKVPESTKKSKRRGTNPQTVRSITNIIDERKDWEKVRKNAEQIAKEKLQRNDLEKMEFFGLKLHTINYLPVDRTFEHQMNIMQKVAMGSRLQRQKRVLYACEIKGWYRDLQAEVFDKVGNMDKSVNALLKGVRKYYQMSYKCPYLARAKLALVVMSMPATEVCHIHMQRALTFLIQEVLEMPEDTLSGWLSHRGLPMVLVDVEEEQEQLQ